MCLQLVDGVGGQGGKDTYGEAWGDTFRYAWLLPRLASVKALARALRGFFEAVLRRL